MKTAVNDHRAGEAPSVTLEVRRLRKDDGRGLLLYRVMVGEPARLPQGTRAGEGEPPRSGQARQGGARGVLGDHA